MARQSTHLRKQSDFTKLLMAGYDLELVNGSTQEFNVTFFGPHGTVYEEGVWQVHVTLPDDYPFASPSIGFQNKMLHPNVDETSGSVCLDVINETWTPLYSLVNVFDVFLPQLLTYPNPSDPLNSEAATLLLLDKTKYELKVREHVKKHASRELWERQRKRGSLVLESGVGQGALLNGNGNADVKSRIEQPHTRKCVESPKRTLVNSRPKNGLVQDKRDHCNSKHLIIETTSDVSDSLDDEVLDQF